MSGTGFIETELLKFTGKYFFMNAAVRGSIRVELMDSLGNAISGFTASACNSLKGDSCKIKVTWKDHPDLAALDGQNIKIKFYLEDADLYSFWISQTEDGKSSGYTAGGGPSLGIYGIDL